MGEMHNFPPQGNGGGERFTIAQEVSQVADPVASFVENFEQNPNIGSIVNLFLRAAAANERVTLAAATSGATDIDVADVALVKQVNHLLNGAFKELPITLGRPGPGPGERSERQCVVDHFVLGKRSLPPYGVGLVVRDSSWRPVTFSPAELRRAVECAGLGEGTTLTADPEAAGLMLKHFLNPETRPPAPGTRMVRHEAPFETGELAILGERPAPHTNGAAVPALASLATRAL